MDVVYVLRHYLAVLKYRCAMAIDDVPNHYPTLEVGSGVRTPLEILHHMNQVLGFAISVINQETNLNLQQKPWEEEVKQFYMVLELLDKHISNGLPDRDRIVEKLLQGPLSDVMTHVGQLSMMRRLAGSPVQGDNFFEADIRVCDDEPNGAQQ